MLPHNFLRSLSTGERSLHKKIVELRNTQFAHSDADPADVSVSVQSMSGALVAMPESRITRLDPAGNELDVLDSILSKLLTAIDVERQRIEATLQFGETF